MKKSEINVMNALVSPITASANLPIEAWQNIYKKIEVFCFSLEIKVSGFLIDENSKGIFFLCSYDHEKRVVEHLKWLIKRYKKVGQGRR